MNKENKKRLSDLHLMDQKKKFPTMPDYARPGNKLTDNSTNGLTKCVISFLNFAGHQAERINTTGRYIDDSKVVKDVLGLSRRIGTGKFIPGTGTKGSADISATIKTKLNGIHIGVSVKIEIKYGKDIQSDAQKKYQTQIEEAGGVYIIVRDFDGFVEWYDKFIDGNI